MRYFLKLAFDGTPFHGWQRQPNAISVQQTLEDALGKITGRATPITGAGRTDTGVHASMMYAHLDMEGLNDKKRFLTSLNNLAGNHISIYDIIHVKDDAHARFDALTRTYRYQIILRKDPFAFRYAHRMGRLPDIERMNEAGRLLVENKDFTSFAKLHSDAKTNICHVSEARWSLEDNSLLTFEIRADRFLRNMVRAVVGTLLEVGTGKITIEQFNEIIEKKDRCAAGTSMPAKGLFLTEIIYPKEIFIL